MKRGYLLSVLLSTFQLIITLAGTAVASQVLGAEAFGHYTVLVTTVIILAFICEFGFPELVVREVAALRVADANARSLRAFLVRLITLFIPLCGGALAIGAVYLTLVGMWDPLVWAAFMLQIVLVGACSISGGVLSGLRRANLAHFLKLILPHLTAAVLIVGSSYWMGPTFAMALGCLTLGYLLSFGLMVLFIRKSLRAERAGSSDVAVPGAAGLALMALPFAGLLGVTVFNAQADILIVGSLHSAKEAGLYAAALQLAGVVALFRRQLGQYASADITRLIKEGRVHELPEMTRPMLVIPSAIGLVLFAGAVAFGDDFMSGFYGPEFEEGYVALVIITAAFASACLFGLAGNIIIMAGHQRESLRVTLNSAIINLVLGVPLIWFFSDIGAAVSLAISVVYWNYAIRLSVMRLLGVDVSALGLIGYRGLPARQV